MAAGDKIFLADKPTLDAIKALIGTANPASGDLSTVFKGLKLLADYVDSLETNLGDTSNPANANGTVLARLAELLVNRLTPARAAKLDNLDSLVSSRQATLGFGGKGKFYTEQPTLQTALNITGKGVLKDLVVYTSATAGRYSHVKITIDGNVVLWGKCPASDQYSGPMLPFVTFLTQDGTPVVFSWNNDYTTYSPNWHFKQSLKIEISTDDGTSQVAWYYELE